MTSKGAFLAALVGTIISFIGSEVVVRAYALLVSNESISSKERMIEDLDNFNKKLITKTSSLVRRVPSWVADQQIQHPFSGYMPKKLSDSPCGPGFANYMCVTQRAVKVNSLGFYGWETENIKTSEGVIRVGVTGGSVANLLVQAKGPLIENLLSNGAFKEQHKKVEVINLAIPGFKYPQQLNSLVYLLSVGYKFDAIIDISGLNEVYLSRHYNMQHQVAYAYPFDIYWHPMDYFSQEQIDVDKINIISRALYLSNSMKDSSALLNSALFRLISFIKLKQMNDKILSTIKVESGNHVADVYSKGGVINSFCVTEKCVQERADLWMVGITSTAAILERNNVYFHAFLQPNHYTVNKDDLSEYDKAMIKEEFGWEKSDSDAWEIMRRYATKKDKADLNITDLSVPYIFKSKIEKSLADGCCHLTHDGYDIMAREVAKRFSERYQSSKIIH